MNLPLSVQQKLTTGVLSAGHARALLGLSDSHAIEALANRIVKEGLSVRATEQVITSSPTRKKTKKLTTVTSSIIEFNEIAERIGDALDTRVRIQGSVKKGTIVVEFAGAEDLKRLTHKLES